ncbi:MAG: tungsten ABC transporter substrate-binding protein [Lachnospiraceae bacterium]|jgi:tungstate transport system substrate-binding protein|nr:tungsten ABC transporter substrate-binding protein [Lachnospiraceae bacterium]
MKKQRQWLAAVLATTLLAGAMTGCGNKEAEAPEETSTEAETPAETPAESEAEAPEDATEAEPEADEAESTPAEKKGVLMMATTTSTADTGLLDYLAPIFLEETGWELQWNAVGTGEALKMGENGDVDIVLVHAKASEEEFVANGFGVERFQVMYNDFIVVGPTEPIAHTDDIEATFKTIQEEQLTFVSRGDDSGTDKKEKGIWTKLELDQTQNPNYLESGQGMGATITMADEKGAYCLTDRGTWLKMKNDADVELQLDVVCEGASDLLNQYGIIAVNPEKYPEVNNEAANTMIEWICSEEVQELIGNYGVEQYGEALFTPNANE